MAVALAAREGRIRRLVVVGCVVGLTCLVLATRSTAATPPIFPAACPTYGDEQICSGEITSFDGTQLDVDLTKPAQNTGSLHPLIVMLHGYGNNKHEWESLTNQGDGADKYDWNSHWFSQHGYYVLTYTARGFRDPKPGSGYQPPTPGGSSAAPESGPNAVIHLKSRDTEIKDTQWLAALVAYSFPDIDPSEVAVTGGSYGGGESWLQASQAQWAFPHQQNPDLPVLQLQVAVPKYPWTDLAYSLAPNGHPGPWMANQPSTLPSGYCDVDQSLADDPCYSSSQGSPTSDSGSGNPIGVIKSSYTAGFYAEGHDPQIAAGFQVSDPCDDPFAPATLPDGAAGPAPVDGWAAQALLVPGEPYSTAPGTDTPPWMAQLRHGLTECRSSYYQDERWQAQAAAPRRVAIFSIQGWTDDLFTPVESFRQFKYLKSLDPNWPVEVALADVGHARAKNNPDTWHYLNQQAWQWLQAHINGSHDQQTNIVSQQTVCDNGPGTENPNDPNQSLTATTPEGLSSGELQVNYSRPGATTSDTPDPNGAVDDPIVNGEVLDQITTRAGNCPTSAGPAPYTAVSDPLPKNRIYIGLGSVTVNYDLTLGTTAQLDARVWDVPPGLALNQAGGPQCQTSPPPPGCPVLITRGTYRLDVQGGYDTPIGQIRIPFFGNHYQFAVGHRIRLDLTQQDTPYLRASNVPSAISFGKPTLNLPTRESGVSVLGGS